MKKLLSVEIYHILRPNGVRSAFSLAKMEETRRGHAVLCLPHTASTVLTHDRRSIESKLKVKLCKAGDSSGVSNRRYPRCPRLYRRRLSHGKREPFGSHAACRTYHY